MSFRSILPQRRPCLTFELEHGNRTFTASVGYWKGKADPAEVFIAGAKVGSDVEATARDGAILLSIALQYGVPLAVIRGALTREQDGRPSTVIGAVVDSISSSVDRIRD